MADQRELLDSVARIQAGELQHFSTLWTQTERFIAMQARKAARQGAGDVEDLTQSGYLALVAAVNSFDASAGMAFLGWLDYHLRSAFAVAGGYRGKKRDALKGAVSLDTPLVDGEDFALVDTIADPLDHYEDAERAIWLRQLRDELDRALEGLPEDERTVMRLRFWSGTTLKEAGEHVGLSPERVRQKEASGLRKLRRPQTARTLRQFLDEQTPFYLRVGVERFQRTGSSSVEEIAMIRERLASPSEK